MAIKKDKDTDIIVSGIDSVRVSLANCCNPIFGDEILGYITKGNGISIHRVNCHNMEDVDDRLVDVRWDDKSNKRYLSELLVHSNSNENHMADIIQKITKCDVNVDGIKTIFKTDTYVYEVTCYVRDLEQLNNLMFNLGKEHYITKVERFMR